VSGFVHLHVHSHFSFMDGAVSLDALIERAKRGGMDSLALTDHQGLSGAIRFYRKARAAGIRPIVGVEIVVEAAGIPGCEADLPPGERLTRPHPAGFGRARAAGFHLTLLAKDLTGYRNLCRLLSAAHLRSGSADDDAGGTRSVVTLRELHRMSEGVIALSGWTSTPTTSKAPPVAGSPAPPARSTSAAPRRSGRSSCTTMPAS